MGREFGRKNWCVKPNVGKCYRQNGSRRVCEVPSTSHAGDASDFENLKYVRKSVWLEQQRFFRAAEFTSKSVSLQGKNTFLKGDSVLIT